MEQQFDEFMRLVASIKQGTVTASLILRKLASYPRQNSLALAVREFGRARTESVHAALHPGSVDPASHLGRGWQKENRATHSRARSSSIAWGDPRPFVREPAISSQRLNLVVAAITMWNTVYLERVVTALMSTVGRRIAAPACRAARLEPHRVDRRLQLARQQTGRQGRFPAPAAAKTCGINAL
jgi:hypothetical protein